MPASWHKSLVLFACIISFLMPKMAHGQEKIPLGYNERRVKPEQHPQDRIDEETKQSQVWTLDFHFKDPRVMTVDLPVRGRRLVWYLWFQVSNNTGQPRRFVPTFVWVNQDPNVAYSSHRDQPLPKAQMAIQRREDPTNLYGIKNTIEISDEKIPYIKQFNDKGERISYPKMVTGVAVWDDIPPGPTQFSIYVYGLSDGWVAIDGPDGKPIIRRKTLQLKFRRLSNKPNQPGQIQYVGHDWIYATLDDPKKDEKDQKAPAGP